MIVCIVILILGLACALIYRDWLHNSWREKHLIPKILKQVTLEINLNNWQTALEKLTPLIEEKKGGKKALLLHCQILRETKKLDEAHQQATNSARLYPEDLSFRLEEAKILYELGRPKEALEAFRVCAPVIRGEADLHAFAAAFLQAGYPVQCWEILEPLLPKTRSGQLLALAGHCMYEQKNFNGAISYFRRAIKMGLRQHSVWIQIGNAFRRLGNLQEAERIFRHLIETDPEDVSATLGLGSCMQERGQYQKALLVYQSSRAWEKQESMLLHEAAYCAFKSGKYHYAQPYLQLLLERHGSAEYYAWLGYVLECQRKWPQAEEIYLNYARLFPSDPKGHRALAWLFGVGLSIALVPEEGMHHAHLSVKLLNDPMGWEILSACEARIGNFDKACEIQTRLAEAASCQSERSRHLHAIRNLKKNLPLDFSLVLRELVA